MTGSRIAAASSCLLALACVPRQSGDHSEVDGGRTELAAAGEQRCAPLPEAAIATLEPSAALAGAGHCGATLELADGQLSVRAIPLVGEGAFGGLAGGEVLASGPVPEDCGAALERCALWGLVDELGPVLLAAVRGPESEVPVQVHVGWLDAGRLGFAPTWYGLPSVADHTRVGPPWALAPFACDGALALLPAARLPEAEVEGPSEALRAAAGRWTIAEDGQASLAESLGEAGPSCRPVFGALP